MTRRVTFNVRHSAFGGKGVDEGKPACGQLIDAQNIGRQLEAYSVIDSAADKTLELLRNRPIQFACELRTICIGARERRTPNAERRTPNAESPPSTVGHRTLTVKRSH
jgi:hypothetical protein